MRLDLAQVQGQPIRFRRGQLFLSGTAGADRQTASPDRLGTGHIQHGCAALCRLWGPKRFIELIARSYAHARGFDEDEAVRLTMEARTAFWTRYSKRHPIDFPLKL